MKNFWAKKEVPPTQVVPTFKQSFTLAERIEKREALRAKYPDGKFCVTVIEGLSVLPSKSDNPKPFILYILAHSALAWKPK